MPDNWTEMVGDKEFLFSKCPTCNDPHKRQQVIRLTPQELDLWDWDKYDTLLEKSVGEFGLLGALALFISPSWLPNDIGVIWMIWTALAVIAAAALALYSIRVSNRAIARRDMTRGEILKKYGSFSPDEVDTLGNVIDEDWSDDPDEEAKYVLVAKGEVVSD